MITGESQVTVTLDLYLISMHSPCTSLHMNIPIYNIIIKILLNDDLIHQRDCYCSKSDTAVQ